MDVRTRVSAIARSATYEIGYGPIVGTLLLRREVTTGKFIVREVIGDTLATLPFTGTRFIGTGTNNAMITIIHRIIILLGSFR
jgi:hypothetical protein